MSRWEAMDEVPVSALPPELGALLDPAQPLPEAVRPGYDPPAHEKLNMARMGLWFTFSIGLLGTLFALTGNRGRTGFYLIVLILCILGLLWVTRIYRQHRAAGGDSGRLGVYVLPQGLLRVREEGKGGRTASFLPREQVSGFAFEEEAEPYAHTVIAVMTGGERWEAVTFPSVGMMHPWHREQLERWLAEGCFDWERYRRPENPQN